MLTIHAIFKNKNKILSQIKVISYNIYTRYIDFFSSLLASLQSPKFTSTRVHFCRLRGQHSLCLLSFLTIIIIGFNVNNYVCCPPVQRFCE